MPRFLPGPSSIRPAFGPFKDESYDGALEVLESILEFGVLKSIRDAKECLDAFRTENEKTEDSIVSSDCRQEDRLQSGTETASDQVFFAATPKNVSKRRRQRRDQGQSSFEDSLRALGRPAPLFSWP